MRRVGDGGHEGEGEGEGDSEGEGQGLRASVCEWGRGLKRESSATEWVSE